MVNEGVYTTLSGKCRTFCVQSLLPPGPSGLCSRVFNYSLTFGWVSRERGHHSAPRGACTFLLYLDPGFSSSEKPPPDHPHPSLLAKWLPSGEIWWDASPPPVSHTGSFLKHACLRKKRRSLRSLILIFIHLFKKIVIFFLCLSHKIAKNIK